MFGWGKSPEVRGKDGSKKSEPFDLGNLGIDTFNDNFELPPDSDVLNEEDLNDPALLEELQALSTGNPKPKQTTKSAPKSKPKPPPSSIAVAPAIDVDALGALGIPNDDEDIEVAFDEEDMKDPALLNELRGLGYQSDNDKDNTDVKQRKSALETNEHKQKDVLRTKMEIQVRSISTVSKNDKEVFHSQVQQKDDPSAIGQSVSITSDVEKVVSFSQTQPTGDSLKNDTPIDVMLLEENIDTLTKYIQQEKLKAVSKNRAGDKAGAMEAMRAYKQLEVRRDQILGKKSTTSNESSQSNVQMKLPAVSKPAENIKSQQTNLTLNPELIASIRLRQEQYMQAMNIFKNTNYQRAKEYMAVAKNLQAVLQSLINGDQLPEGWTLPKEPDVSEKAQPPAPSTPKKKVAANVTPKSTPKQRVLTAIDATKSQLLDEEERLLTTMSKEDQYARLLAKLESQISLCTTISAYYLKSGDKSQASFFHKYKKTFIADLESLTSYQKHGKDIPPFHYKEVTYNVENAFFDLSANDMEVCIEKAWSLGNKEVNGKDVEAYVNFDIGWPPEGSPGAGSGKGDTSVAKRGMDPEFNWKKTLSIERNKAFQRHIDRKKALFEVFHYRGFFRKATSLGKAQVKLDSLANKSEIHEVVELVDNNRRPTGGKLEIRLRLRAPLLKADVISKTEKWLIIDDLNTNHPLHATPKPSASSSDVTSSKSSSTSTPLRKNPINPDTSEAEIPILPKATTTNEFCETPSQVSAPAVQKLSTHTKNVQSTDVDQDELEHAEEQLNNVDLLVSSKLLQQESEIIDAEIATLNAQQKPVPDELLDRKSAIQIKMSLMEVQVQTGQLTIDKYIEQVKASVVSCKKLALVFKKAGKLEAAKKVLVRSKVMEGEVKEIEEAMASGAMGGE
ncbi:9206_t:CDS:2 [Acaulospora morrowiae]|uniref:9206_t:CDS:1 n=1 Tax=Acaulospora morrowiae TaxID=94023 RepID=A0A9N9ALJ1_9GLOM|nr:9206_t:CDS:2 [Acaulospora morrowiae]